MKLFLILIPLFLLCSCGDPVTTYPPLEPPTTPPTEPTTPVIPPAEPITPADPTPPTTPDETEPNPESVPVQSELDSYISNFESRNLMAGGSLNPSNLQVVFADDLPSNVLGTCSMNMAYVKINRSFWDVLSKASREELIFHELGHCVLGRLHDNTKDSQNNPVSIMNSYHMGPGVYLRSVTAYRSYMAELFGANYFTFSAISFSDQNYASKTNSMASIYRPDYNDEYLNENSDVVTCKNH